MKRRVGIPMIVVAVALMALAATAGLLRCAALSEAVRPRGWDGSILTISDQPRAGGLNVTFYVASDTHVGGNGQAGRFGSGWMPIEPMLEAMIDQMNGLAGTPYPQQIDALVDEPRGVLISGDLTEDGLAREWDGFVGYFGITGAEGRLKYPVFEGAGNHDKHEGSYVAGQIAARHGGHRYSWDWDDLHMVCLGDGPDNDTLRWLMADLAAVGRERPVIVYFHYPLDGPYSDSNWFGKGEYRSALAKILQGFNIAAIFHGHYHGTGHYRWNGFDVYNVGSAKHGAKDFAVVQVTDSALTVAAWNWEGRRWWWAHRKSINAGAGEQTAAVDLDWMDERLRQRR